MNKFLLPPALAVLASIASAGGGGGNRQPARNPGTAALHPCKDLKALPTAQCGTLRVPLDRTNPSAGTTDISFALLPRRDQTKPSLGTIVPNPGGPGTATIAFAGPLYAAALAPILNRRELLLIDTRGVGRSSALSCPALNDPARVFGSIQQQRAAIGKCGSELGHKARFYGTVAIADDFNDVRAALGIKQFDLLGDSYGTFLMTTYAQRYPNHVRSVILSGAYPVNPTASSDLEIAGLRRAITLVGERTGAYAGADMLRGLQRLAAQLRERPDTLKVTFGSTSYSVTLDEWALASAVGKIYSRDPDTTTQLALATAVQAAGTGNLDPIRRLVRAHVITMATDLTGRPEVASDAANWAISCHDYQQAFKYADSVATRTRVYHTQLAAQDAKDFYPFSPEAWITRDSYDSGACLHWPNDPTASTPFPAGTVLEDLPVLVLSGDLDANTTRESSRLAAAQFPSAQWVEIRGAGHTPSSTTQGQKRIIRFISELR